MLKVSNDWTNYECLDAGGKEKVERWNNIILIRPEPSAVWPKSNNLAWEKCHGHYYRSETGGGHWEFTTPIKKGWTINYKDLTFKISPTDFKHTGIFPEQATNWDYIISKIKESSKPIKVLNLFAYTGAATMAASFGGAMEVVHVDASKGMIEWAKENQQLCHLEDKTIRYICDDVLKFIKRENRRGHKYQAIIMDPPSYGRGPNKELWKLEDNLNDLISECLDLLDNEPLFVLINCYTTGFSHLALKNLIERTLLKKYPDYQIETGEIALPITTNNSILPCGIYARFSR